MKILLIDDDDSLLTIFNTAFQKNGFQTTTATDGASGMEKAKNEDFDLILVDQILPDMRGNDIVKTLKALERTKNTPLLILSNFGQNELIEEAMRFGATDYILKYQIEPDDLVKKVREVLVNKATPAEQKMPEDPMIGQE